MCRTAHPGRNLLREINNDLFAIPNNRENKDSASTDILEAMPIHRVVILVLAGLCCMWLCVRIGKFLWRELNEFLRDQRFGE
jgi:hypothetical protein